MGTDEPDFDELIAPDEEAPSNEAAELDERFWKELSKVNYQLAKYIVRRAVASPIPVSDEMALAELLATAAQAVHIQAERRAIVQHGHDA